MRDAGSPSSALSYSVAGFQVSGFGFEVLDFGSLGFGFRVSGFGSRVSGFGFRISDFGCRISSFEFLILEGGFNLEAHFLRGFRGLGRRDSHSRLVDHSCDPECGFSVYGLRFGEGVSCHTRRWRVLFMSCTALNGALRVIYGSERCRACHIRLWRVPYVSETGLEEGLSVSYNALWGCLCCRRGFR